LDVTMATAGPASRLDIPQGKRHGAAINILERAMSFLRKLLAPLIGLFAGGAAVAAVAADLVIEDIREGEGSAAKAGDQVIVHYDGRLADGTPFDSSRDRGQPFGFQLGVGQVIKGWDQGVEGMKPGGQRKLTIPPELGYGARGVGPIPGGATLVFDVELLEIR